MRHKSCCASNVSMNQLYLVCDPQPRAPSYLDRDMTTDLLLTTRCVPWKRSQFLPSVMDLYTQMPPDVSTARNHSKDTELMPSYPALWNEYANLVNL